MDEITERNISLNNSKNIDSKDEYENRSTNSKMKSELSFDKVNIQVLKPMKLKEKENKKNQNKSFTKKNLINFISPNISEVGTGNQDIMTIEKKEKKMNKSNLLIEVNNSNKRKNLKRIHETKNKIIMDTNLDTVEALTSKKNNPDNQDEEEIEDDFIINKKISLNLKGTEIKLK